MAGYNEQAAVTLDILPGTMSGIAAVSAGMNSLVDTMDTFGRAVGKDFGVVETMTVAAGAIAAGALKKAVDAAGEYEYSMQMVQTISQQSGAAMQQLSEQATELGQVYSTSFNDIAEGLQTLGRAGLNNATTQTEVLAQGLQTAKLEGSNLQTTLETLVQTTALLGGNIDDVDFGKDTKYINDLMVGTSMAAPLDVSDVAQTLQYSGGMAAIAGANLDDKSMLEDYMGAIAAFAQKGVTGSVAGTALRAFFNKSANQDSSVTEALSTLQLSSDALWEDGGEKMKPVSEQIGLIQKQMDKLNLSTYEQVEIWSKIVGGKMGQQMLKLNAEDIENMTSKVKEGADTEGLSNQLINTYSAQLDRLKAEGEAAFRSIGEHGLVYATKALGVINNIIEAFQNPYFSATVFVTGIRIVVAALDKAWTIIKGVVTGLKSLGTNIDSIKTSLQAMNSTLEKTSIQASKAGKSVFGVGGGIDTMGAKKFNKTPTSQPSKPERTPISINMSELNAASRQINNISKVWNTTINEILISLNKISPVGVSNILKINNMFNNFGTNAINIINKINSSLLSNGQITINRIVSGLKQIDTYGNNVFGTLNRNLGRINTPVNTTIDRVVSGLGQINTLWQKTYTTIISGVNGVERVIGQKLSSIKNKGEGTFNALEGTMGRFGNVGRNALTTLLGNINVTLSEISAQNTSVLSRISSARRTATNTILETERIAGDGRIGIVQKATLSITEIINNATKTIGQSIASISKNAIEAAANIEKVFAAFGVGGAGKVGTIVDDSSFIGKKAGGLNYRDRLSFFLNYAGMDKIAPALGGGGYISALMSGMSRNVEQGMFYVVQDKIKHFNTMIMEQMGLFRVPSFPRTFDSRRYSESLRDRSILSSANLGYRDYMSFGLEYAPSDLSKLYSANFSAIEAQLNRANMFSGTNRWTAASALKEYNALDASYVAPNSALYTANLNTIIAELKAIEIGVKSNRWNITGDLNKLEGKPTPKYTPSTFGGLYGQNVEDINALLDGGLESLSDDDKKAISNYTNKKNKFAQLENFLASDVFKTQNEIQHALSEKADATENLLKTKDLPTQIAALNSVLYPDKDLIRRSPFDGGKVFPEDEIAIANYQKKKKEEADLEKFLDSNLFEEQNKLYASLYDKDQAVMNQIRQDAANAEATLSQFLGPNMWEINKVDASLLNSPVMDPYMGKIVGPTTPISIGLPGEISKYGNREASRYIAEMHEESSTKQQIMASQAQGYQKFLALDDSTKRKFEQAADKLYQESLESASALSKFRRKISNISAGDYSYKPYEGVEVGYGDKKRTVSGVGDSFSAWTKGDMGFKEAINNAFIAPMKNFGTQMKDSAKKGGAMGVFKTSLSGAGKGLKSLTNLIGGPVMAAFMGIEMVMTYFQEAQKSYLKEIQKASDYTNETKESLDSARDAIKEEYKENNPDATEEEIQKYLDSKTDEIINAEDNDNVSALDENTQALRDATAVYGMAIDNEAQKIASDYWFNPNDGIFTQISDFGGYLASIDLTGLSGIPGLAWLAGNEGKRGLKEGGILKPSQADENYPWSTEMGPILMSNIRSGGLSDGLFRYYGKDYKDDIAHGFNGIETMLKQTNKGAGAIGLNRTAAALKQMDAGSYNAIQTSMKKDKAPWQRIAKQMARVEARSGKGSAYSAMNRRGKKATVEDVKLRNLVRQMQKELGGKVSYGNILAAASLQQLQDMQEIANTQIYPTMQSSLNTAIQHYTAGLHTSSSTGSTANSSASTSANAAAIAALLAVKVQMEAEDAAWREYQRTPGNNKAKDQNEFMQRLADGKLPGYERFIYNIEGVAATAVGYPGSSTEYQQQMSERHSKQAFEDGKTYKDRQKLLGQWIAGITAPQIEASYLTSDMGENGAGGNGQGGGGGGGGGGDGGSGNKGDTEEKKKSRVDLVLCNKKEIPKLNVNLFKKPPSFTILNKNFKLRDIKVNTQDKPKAIVSAVKNAIIDTQKRTDPKIIQDEGGEYDPVAATDGNATPTGTTNTSADSTTES